MIKIIPYEKKYLAPMCDLIQRTFLGFNKKEFSKEWAKHYIHFYDLTRNRERLEMSTTSPNSIAYLAMDKNKVVGVVRWGKEYCTNLFVDGDYQRQGIAWKLMEAYENNCKKLWAKIIKLRATQYAVPFYAAYGFKKTTWLRSYKGRALVQPMKKVLSD